MFSTSVRNTTPPTTARKVKQINALKLQTPKTTRKKSRSSRFVEKTPPAIAARKKHLPLPFSTTSASASATRIVHEGGSLAPAVRLRGAWALQRERSDHLQAELDTRNLQLDEAKQIQSRLAAEVSLRDNALERGRRCARQDQGTVELLTSQLEDLKSDLMAERARCVAASRVHEDMVREHEVAEQQWEVERHKHDHLQNTHRETVEQFRATEEEMVKMHTLYDAVESERNELQQTVSRMVGELQLLRHVKAQKEKNVVLLLKEQERLHRDLSKEKKRGSRRKRTTETLSQSRASAARTAQFEREKTHQLLSEMVSNASVLESGGGKRDRTLREKIAVLAAQVKKEKDRNVQLQQKLETSTKTSTALRVRLRNHTKKNRNNTTDHQ